MGFPDLQINKGLYGHAEGPKRAEANPSLNPNSATLKTSKQASGHKKINSINPKP